MDEMSANHPHQGTAMATGLTMLVVSLAILLAALGWVLHPLSGPDPLTPRTTTPKL